MRGPSRFPIRAPRAARTSGLLPPGLQSFVVYGTAVPAYNGAPEPAVAFVKLVSQPGKGDLWKAAGFELIGAGN